MAQCLIYIHTVFQDEDRCCETGKLKTEDNNWEKGQVNYFVGFQMGDCQDFNLDGKGNMYSFRLQRI